MVLLAEKFWAKLGLLKSLQDIDIDVNRATSAETVSLSARGLEKVSIPAVQCDHCKLMSSNPAFPREHTQFSNKIATYSKHNLKFLEAGSRSVVG